MEKFSNQPGWIKRTHINFGKGALKSQRRTSTQCRRQKFRIARHFGDEGKDGDEDTVFSQMFWIGAQSTLQIRRRGFGSADVKNNSRNVLRDHNGTFTAFTSLPFSYR